MKLTRQKKLETELRSAGAATGEIKELLPLAANLSRLKSQPPRRLKLLRPAALVLSGAAVGMALVVWSQAALPTSLLYPVQKLSDNIAVAVHPDYRANVMMKRAQQVNELVAAHAGTNKVLATLNDYTKEANAYKTTQQAGYSSFEYCKTNLQQASATAPPEVRQAISNSLQSLQNV